MNFVEEIKAYQPYNEQEEMDKAQMLHWIDTGLDLLTRQQGFAHFSSSSWIVNEDCTKVLLAYHKIYQSYTWLGGHVDGEEDFLQVAIREAQEEANLQNIHVLQDGIFSLEIVTVDGHVKNGKYVPSHLHLNVTYLLQASESEHIQPKLDENTSVKWFALDEVNEVTSEPWFQEHIYNKLNEKLRKRYE